MTEGGWVPNPEELTNCVLLIQALRDPTRSDHKMALSALNQSGGNPSTVLHILHVFARGGAYESMGLSADLRQLAGLVVKNYTFPHLPHLPTNVQQMLKQEILHALSDTQMDIRNTAGILIGRISDSFMIDTWADLLPPLYQMLDYKVHGQLTLVDGALQALRRMFEDSVEKLCMDHIRNPLDILLPKLIALFTCPEEMIRLRALETINSSLFLLSTTSVTKKNVLSPSNSENNLSNGVISRVGHGKVASPSIALRKQMENGSSNGVADFTGSQALISNMTTFLSGLSGLSSDPSAKVRKAVCQSITFIATMQLAILEPYFSSICQFMLKGVLDDDEGVAMEACEFWSALSDDNDAHSVLQSHLCTLIPSLISRLQLKEEQVMSERIEEEAHATGEKEVNFKPIHRRGREDQKDRDDEEAELSAKWTLRKQAALVLDNLAVTFTATMVLPFALPAIQAKLMAEGTGPEMVWVRESGMLALGALSTGCLVEMGQYLPQLFPFLIQNLADPTPEMSSIACWVLSRYCSWIFEDEQVQMDGASDRYFVQLLEALLGILLNPRPKVQTACCSALCTLIEVAGPDPIIPFLPQLLSYVQQAFSIYGIKSSLILVDTIGTIADIVGDALSDNTLVPLYFPKLIEKFGELEDDDMRLFPILECLTSVVAASGLECQPYAHGLYFRCLRIIGNTMSANAIADAKIIQNGGNLNDYTNGIKNSKSSGSLEGQMQEGEDIHDGEDEAPAKDFAICALDVLSGLCEGLETSFVTLAESSRDSLLKLMLTCLQDNFPELRQSAFALTGDLCKNCIHFITPIAPQLIDIILRNLDFDYPMVCNNASWTLGELAIKVGGASMAPYITRLMHSFIQILREKDIPSTLTENVAITVGRLGVTNTAQLAGYLSDYLEPWCMALRLTRQSHEKDHAFAGLIALINANPQVLLSPSSVTVPNAFFVACSSWEDPPDEPLLSELSRILRMYKSTNESGWRAMMTVMDRVRANRVIDMFRISA